MGQPLLLKTEFDFSLCLSPISDTVVKNGVQKPWKMYNKGYSMGGTVALPRWMKKSTTKIQYYVQYVKILYDIMVALG
jgi:hypothetical protein